MATRTFRATLDASGAARCEPVADVAGSAASVDSTDTEAAIAAAQAIGAGDASAEIDAADAAFVIYKAAVDAAVASAGAASGGLQVTIDTSVVTNLNQLKAALDAVYRRAEGSGAFLVG